MFRTSLAAALLAAAVLPAAAHDYELGGLTVDHPWARAMPPMTTVGAGYMMIGNAGGEADRLLSVASPRAGGVQIHEMRMDGDVAKMREMKGGVEIPAGGGVALAPGGYHLMFMGVEQSFEEGESVPATLTFEKAGTLEIEFSVAPVGATAPASGGHAGGMEMDHPSHGPINGDGAKTE